MDATPEGNVGGIVATDVEPVRIVEASGIAFGRPEEHGDLLADLEFLAGDHDAGFQHPPLEQLQGCVPPQQFLDGCLGRHLAAYEALPLTAVEHQRPQPVAERVDRRLVPGLEQHHRGRDDLGLGERVTFVLDADEFGDEQGVGVPPLLGDERLGVVDVLGGGPVGGDHDLFTRCEFVHLHDVVRPVEQRLGVIAGDTQHRADDGDRVRLGVVGEQFEPSGLGGSVTTRVEEFVRPAFDLGSHRRDGARREHLGDEATDAGVVRRFETQQRPRLVLLERRPSRVGFGSAELGVGVARRVRAPEPPIPQRLVHVGEPCDRPLPGLFVPEARRRLAQVVECGVGVGEERRICRSERADNSWRDPIVAHRQRSS